MKVKIKFKCKDCNKKFMGKWNYDVKKRWPDCPFCKAKDILIYRYWFFHPVVFFDHIKVSSSWIYFHALCSDIFFRGTMKVYKKDKIQKYRFKKGGINHFESAKHCKDCFVLILFLKITVFPFVYLLIVLDRIYSRIKNITEIDTRYGQRNPKAYYSQRIS